MNTEEQHLTKEEGMSFFSEFYGGEHHIPKHEIFPWGRGWMVKHDRGEMSTYDDNKLTRLVIMAHDKCVRVSVEPLNMGTMRIIIFKRKAREGSIFDRHPTIETAIENYRPKQS